VVNVARIRGGDDLFVVPDVCVVEGTARFPPGYEGPVREGLLSAASHSWGTPFGEAHSRVNVTVTADAAHTPVESPLVRALLGSARAVVPEAAAGPFPATCDARHFAAAGMPIAIIGPGSLARAHGPEEYLTLGELFSAARLMTRLALSWCA
jgi:acetylornithine deacetylase